MNKILVIPSWYPTTDSPAIGNFCKEQTELVSDTFDIKVIYPRRRLVGKKTMLKRLFRSYIPAIKNNLLGNIPGVQIEATSSSFVSEKRRVDHLIKACNSNLLQLISNGWVPDIIHAHATCDAGIVASALGQKHNIPVIITEHHSLLVPNFNEVSWSLYQNALESAKLVITVSNELNKMILMNGINCNTAVLGNLIDEDLFYSSNMSSDSDVFTILFIAVPAKTKDIPTFIRSLSELKKNGVNRFQAKLVIPDVPADLTIDDIKALCSEYGVIENCIFFRNLEHKQIPDMINTSDVLVSTSISETFGLSVAEALMCGKPVIVTKSGGVEDFVTSENGQLVNIGDYKGIAHAINRLIKGEIKTDTAAIRKQMISRFGKQAFKQRLCDTYNKFLHD
jgi:glycosyltransferase involved in cell wall biosynthesis